jgi:hydroxymethylpyrimidine/phosphomethylpyrimidine kinase
VVAGFDGSGGAGVLRDVAAIGAAGGRARSAVAAVTAQDQERFDAAQAVDPALLRAQLEAASRGGFDAMKVGMVGSAANVEVVAAFLWSSRSRRGTFPVVLDPVLAASAGAVLADDATRAAIRSRIVPLATVLTPNVPEAEALTGRTVADVAAMTAAARDLRAAGAAAVVVKGGHLPGARVADVVLDQTGHVHVLERQRVAGRIHGSGCLFSSTLAVHVAAGRDLVEAASLAASAVAAAISTQVST